MEHRRPGSPSGSDPLEGLLEHWQKALIDLGFRNRLVSYRRTTTQAGMDITTPGLPAILGGPLSDSLD